MTEIINQITIWNCFQIFFVVVLCILVYREKRSFDKRCHDKYCQCRDIKITHYMTPVGEVGKWGDGRYDSISIGECNRCKTKWLYKTCISYFNWVEITWRKIFHHGEFKPADENLLNDVLGLTRNKSARVFGKHNCIPEHPLDGLGIAIRGIDFPAMRKRLMLEGRIRLGLTVRGKPKIRVTTSNVVTPVRKAA